MDSEQGAKYEALLSSIGDGVMATDTEGKVIFMNHAAETSLGWKSEEFLGKNLQEVLGLYNRNGVAVSFQERPFEIALTTGKATETSASAAITSTANIYFYQRKDGTRFPVAITVTAIILNKEIIGTIEVFRDITKEIELDKARAGEQEKEKTAEAKEKALLASIGDGVIATDNAGIGIVVNHAAELLLGGATEDFLGKKLHDVVNIYDDKGIPVPFEKRPIQIALTTGRTTSTADIDANGNTTYFYERKDGTRFPAAITVTPVLLDNKIIGAINIFRDVTREKELEKGKDELISLASHQLRNPITAISWSMEALLDGSKGPLSDEQKEMVGEAHRASKNMEELVGGFLDIAKMESVGFALGKGDVDLPQISDSVLEELSKQISDKKLTITKQYGTDVTHLDIGTKTARIILQNLLTNAVKYTPDNGAVEVKIEKAAEGISISVKDNGYGIPEEAKKKIFTKLFRANNVMEKEPSGTGLGLYLLKSLVDKLGGKVWFESTEGAGTTFHVNLK